MRGLATWLGLAVAFAGCGSVKNAESCKVACTTDDDCPSQQTCGALGRCSSGEACPCEAGAFLGCVESDASALFCGTGGAGVSVEACAGGCNDSESRCNTCTPSTAACSTDETSVESCAEDGVTTSTDNCALACSSAGDAPHCGYISPLYMPDVCDSPATEAMFSVPSGVVTLDTGLDTSCTGGIITPAVGPAICVVRYDRIQIAGTLRAVGTRALALVANTELEVTGSVSASAAGTTNGAGAAASSGSAQTGASGGGGAGFRQAGAAGGNTTLGGGSAGGPIADVSPDVWGLKGGAAARAGANTGGYSYPRAGGGGGAVSLVACRGVVDISGVVVSSGGGGSAGAYLVNALTPGMIAVGGTGGGAGGLIVIQGASVAVTGGLYANGGAGGGGCDASGCTPMPGQDGLASTGTAAGGVGAAGGNGGPGGTFNAPGPGAAGKGGGGGSAGFIKIYVPETGTLTSTTALVSPAFERGTISVR